MLMIAQNRLNVWRENPIRFAREEFGIEPDAWQAEALMAFASPDRDRWRIAMKACAGPGKTLVLGICGWNFLACYGEPGDHPKGAAVSITEQNLKTNLWPEFYKLHDLSRLKGSGFIFNAFACTKSRIFAKDHPNTWFIEARSFSKDANPDEQGRTLSGLHAKRVLFLIDESGDIPQQVGKAAEQALSNCSWGKILQAGNPTSTEGMLYTATQRLADQWHVITITGDPDDVRRSPRIRIEWAQEQIAKYGRDDPWVMAYILGQFPPNAINSLLSIEDVERAIKRVYHVEQLEGSQKRLGIDVAREGLDKTSLFPRWGLQAFKPVQMSNAKGHDVAARAALAQENWNWEMCFVDDTGGYGSSVCDSFTQAGISHVPVNFGSKPIDARYFNRRSEMLFKMADWVKTSGALPDIPSLRQEMPALKYTFKQGKFAVIDKEMIKKIIGHSPDDCDALALTFAFPEVPGQTDPLMIGGFQRGMKMHSDFDPFRNENKREAEIDRYMASSI